MSPWGLSCMLLAVPPGVLVDGIAMVVEKQVVTHSELQAEARVALALREGGKAAAAEMTPEFLEAFREYLTNELLVAMQARRLGTANVSDDEIKRLLDEFAQRFSSDDAYRAFLRRFEIREEHIANILRRNSQNERFIAQRLRLRTLGQAGRESTDNQRYTAALKKWLQELRENASIWLPGPSGVLERQ